MHPRTALMLVGLLAAFPLLLGPTPVRPTDRTGQEVDLDYNFGNTSGILPAAVGAGSEFVLDVEIRRALAARNAARCA